MGDGYFLSRVNSNEPPTPAHQLANVTYYSEDTLSLILPSNPQPLRNMKVPQNLLHCHFSVLLS